VRVCWRCQGDGSIAVPGYSISPYSGTSVVDPQAETSERCDICHGAGEIEEGVTREELDQYIQGEVLDITMIDDEHPLAKMCRHPGKIFRVTFEKTQAQFDPDTAPLAEPRKMRPITSTIVWGVPVEDTPDTEAYYIPTRDDPRFADGLPRDLRYGLHTHLIKEIERVNG
jgi:hypothetical protein